MKMRLIKWNILFYFTKKCDIIQLGDSMETIISILFIILTILGTSFLCLLNYAKQEEKRSRYERNHKRNDKDF